MFNFSGKFKKIFLPILIGVLMFINLTPLVFAQEDQVEDESIWNQIGSSIGNYITSAITPTLSKLWGVLVYGTAFLIGQLGALTFQFGGYLLEIVLDWNAGVQQSPLVNQGWTMLRNLANLGFILAIIFIAFATMLRIESYGIKRLFVRLVVVAVLINFSLAISGVILNFSDSLTQFFIESAAGKGEGRAAITSMVENLATTISPQKLLNTDKLTISDYAEAFTLNKDFFTTLGGLIFASAFTVLAAGGVLAIVATGFIRYFIITSLLILAPLAWLSFVIPPIDYFKKWWSKLLQWSMFMPTMMFFLYLAIILANSSQLKLDKDSPYLAAREAQTGYIATNLGKIFNDYADMMLAISIMITGLFVGEKFSIAGAATGMAFAQMSKNWALGVAREGGRRINPLTMRVGDSTLGQKAATGLAKIGLSGVPLLREIPRGLARASVPAKGLAEERQKELSGLTDELLLAEAGSQSPSLISDVKATAYIKELAKRKGKLLKKMDIDQLKALMEKAKLFGVKDDVYKQRLDLVPDADIEKMVKKLDPKKFLEEVDDDMLKETRFVRAMSPKQKAKLADDGSDLNKAAYVEGLNKLVKALKDGGAGIPEISKDEHLKYALQNTTIRDIINKNIEKNPDKFGDIKELFSYNIITTTPEFTAAGIRDPLINLEAIQSELEERVYEQEQSKVVERAEERSKARGTTFKQEAGIASKEDIFSTEEFK